MDLESYPQDVFLHILREAFYAITLKLFFGGGGEGLINFSVSLGNPDINFHLKVEAGPVRNCGPLNHRHSRCKLAAFTPQVASAATLLSVGTQHHVASLVVS